MSESVVSFRNLFEFLVTSVTESNFTLNAIWLACGFGILLIFKAYQQLHNLDASFADSARYVSHSLPLEGRRIEPRSITNVDCNDTKTMDRVLGDLVQSGSDWFPILGLDCEMKNGRGPVPEIVLMQFANRFGDCVLVRFPSPRCLESRQFLNIITDPYTWKVGVGVFNDLDYFAKNYPEERIIPQGTFDLRLLAEDAGIRERGLKDMASKLLGIGPYDQREPWARWDSPQLTPAQIKYAAMDALLGVLLFERFFEMTLEKKAPTLRITEEIKKQEIPNFLYTWFESKSQQYSSGLFSTRKLIYLCNWLSKLILGRR